MRGRAAIRASLARRSQGLEPPASQRRRDLVQRRTHNLVNLGYVDVGIGPARDRRPVARIRRRIPSHWQQKLTHRTTRHVPRTRDRQRPDQPVQSAPSEQHAGWKKSQEQPACDRRIHDDESGPDRAATPKRDVRASELLKLERLSLPNRRRLCRRGSPLVSKVSNLTLKKLIHPSLRLLAVKLSIEKIVKCRAISASQKPGVEPTQKLAAKARPHG